MRADKRSSSAKIASAVATRMNREADALYWAMNASIVSTSWANAVERTALDGALANQTEQISSTLSSPSAGTMCLASMVR